MTEIKASDMAENTKSPDINEESVRLEIKESPKPQAAFSIDDVLNGELTEELTESEILKNMKKFNPRTNTLSQNSPDPQASQIYSQESAYIQSNDQKDQKMNSSQAKGYGIKVSQPNPSMRFSPPIQNVNTQSKPVNKRNVPKQKKSGISKLLIAAAVVLLIVVGIEASGSGKKSTTADNSAAVAAKVDPVIEEKDVTLEEKEETTEAEKVTVTDR
jgi:hypothetical protein